MLSRNAIKCPLHPTVPCDCEIFPGMSTCPSHSCMCVPLPSHNPMGHSPGCPPVPLTHACVSHFHPTIPWDIPRDVHLSLLQVHVCPMGSWDGMDNGTHTHLREGQVDIPGNVPQSHGTGGWDGHFTAFLETYGFCKGVADSPTAMGKNLAKQFPLSSLCKCRMLI